MLSWPKPSLPGLRLRELERAWQRRLEAAAQWIQPLVQLAIPAQCSLCGGCSREGPWPSVCLDCQAALPRLEAPFCRVCARFFAGQTGSEFRCSNCAGMELAFDFATAPLRHEEGSRRLVIQFKHNRALWLLPFLGSLLRSMIRGPGADPRLAGKDWLIVPVPLHHTRLRERGYDQAALLAQELADATDLACAPVLRRVRRTELQAGLDGHQRRVNLAGAFALHWRRGMARLAAGRDILLIDDVLTTGATAHACASVLRRKGGAASVAVLALARR